MIAPALVAGASCAAQAQPATAPLDAARFDRCSASSAAVRLLARQSRYRGSEGFDARACPMIPRVDELEESAPGNGGGRGLTVSGAGGLAVDASNAGGDLRTPVLLPTLALSGGDRPRSWRVDTSYSADIIITTASPRSADVRHLATLAGEAKIGPARVGIDGGLSVERGYVGRTVGATLSAGLGGRVTPMLAYHLGFDIIGRPETPFQQFHRDLFAHVIAAGASIALEPTTDLVLMGTTAIERGNTSSPSVYLPLFNEADAAALDAGATASDVQRFKLPISPLEQLPTSRSANAAAGACAMFGKSVTSSG